MSDVDRRREFVNRDHQISAFKQAVLAVGTHANQVLSFHGAGGQGKTQLCLELARRLKNGDLGPGVRWGTVDLKRYRDSERQSFYPVLWVRNRLKEQSRVRFPAFDLAFELFWKQSCHNQPLPSIDHPWWKEMEDATSESIIEATPHLLEEASHHLLKGVPVVGSILASLARRAMELGRKEVVVRTNAALTALLRGADAVPEEDIGPFLPALLARDLDAWRSRHPNDRFVVLIDEYDKALESAWAGGVPGDNSFDAAVRDLVQECRGTLFVLFSRERLSWDQLDSAWVQTLQDREVPLGGLSREDSVRFLENAGIFDTSLQSAMIEGASARDHAVGNMTCYPIMLDLQVKVFEELRGGSEPLNPAQFRIDGEEFEPKRRQLLANLLSRYGLHLAATLKRLAFPRQFDRNLFLFVIEKFRTGFPGTDWEAVAGVSLVQEGEVPGVFRFHDVVRVGLIAQLEEPARCDVHLTLFEYFERSMHVAEGQSVTSTHATAATEAFYHKRAVDPKAALMWWEAAGRQFRGQGIDRFVEEIDRECVEIAAKTFGETSRAHVEQLSWRAVNLDAQGRHSEAEPLYRRALKISGQSSGSYSHHAAAILSNLAVCLDHQGRYSEAEPLHRRSLKLRLDASGPDHKKTASCLAGLATNLDHQGRYIEAELLLWRAIAVRGPSNRYSATTYDLLGLNLGNQGRLVEAESAHRRAVRIREKYLPPDHIRVGWGAAFLAHNLDCQGRHTDAEPLFRQSLKIARQILDPDHPNVALVLASLANNLSHQGRNMEAEPMFREALDNLDPLHPNAATIRHNLGRAWDDAGRHREAEQLHAVALETRKRMVGPEHPDLAESCSYLATNLDHQGRHVEAERHHRDALHIRRKAFGNKRRETTDSLRNLATNLEAQQRFVEAEELLRELLAVREELFGPTSSQVFRALRRLVSNLESQGRFDAAEELKRRMHSIEPSFKDQKPPDAIH